MKRPLTLFDVTCIGVNAIVGSSIFLFPARLAGLLGPASVLSFGVAAVLLGAIALCFAEASSRFDGHGGPYLYTREAFGPTAGFAIGWMCWAAEILSWAAVADGIALYLGFLGPVWSSVLVVKGIAVFVIVSMGAINFRGVKLGAWTSNFFTLAKLVPLAVLIAAGLPRVRLASLAPFAPHGWKPMGAACYLALFSYSGFECVPVPAGEVDGASRNVPIAVVASMALAALVYMAVQLAAVALVPNLASSAQPLADAARVALGPAGAAMIVAGAVISTTGFSAGAALGGPRYLVALGQSGDMPRWTSRLHPRFGTPDAAIAITTGATLVCALALDFNRLVDITVVVICAQYLATCAAVPFLRRGGAASFHLLGGWLIPAGGAAATVWLAAQGGWAEARFSLWLLAAGFALRALTRAFPSRQTLSDAAVTKGES